MNNLNKLKEREQVIQAVTESICKVLTEKNRRYGNSAGEPLNVFSALNPIEGIRQRLDDKLKRVKTSTLANVEPNKNDIFDLIGYLTLYCVEKGWDNFDDLLD